MRIRILYFEGCPNHRPTVELVKQVVSELGIRADIDVQEANSRNAQDLRFLGSPTVQVDGQDIEPAARDRTDFAMSCRMYGPSGVPPRELVEAALAQEK